MPKLQSLPFAPPTPPPNTTPPFFSEIKEENDLVAAQKGKARWMGTFVSDLQQENLLVRHYKCVFCGWGRINLLHQDGESICTQNVKHRNKWIKLIPSCQPRRLIPHQLHQEAKEQLTCNDWARWDHHGLAPQQWLRVLSSTVPIRDSLGL